MDINLKMLAIAKQKIAQTPHTTVQLRQGDMRHYRTQPKDAVISIFNSIGHLTTDDFKTTLLNIHHNLKPNGFYIFDIFNLDYLRHSDHITRLKMDRVVNKPHRQAREIQYSTINDQSILTSYDIYYGHNEVNSGWDYAVQTLQTYTATELKDLLKNNRFQVVNQTDINGNLVNNVESERILTVAQKI